MTWDKHLKHLEEVLETIEASGFRLRLSKCKFAQKQVKLLGQIVGGGKILVDPQKVEAVLKIKPPTTKKEIQHFIGILSYYRNFIPNLSKKALCLTELTKGKKANNLTLNDEELAAFEELKRALVSAEVLAIPIFDGKTPFLIQCDASQHAVAACLAQRQADGIERPIAFASAKLTSTQKNWSTIEKEGFAVIFGLRRFETYLIGAPIVIYTDHNPLKYIVECSPKSARLTRWSLSLQKFNITSVIHKPGLENVNVDVLSRLMTNIDDTGQSLTPMTSHDVRFGEGTTTRKHNEFACQTPTWMIQNLHEIPRCILEEPRGHDIPRDNPEKFQSYDIPRDNPEESRSHDSPRENLEASCSHDDDPGGDMQSSSRIQHVASDCVLKAV